MARPRSAFVPLAVLGALVLGLAAWLLLDDDGAAPRSDAQARGTTSAAAESDAPSVPTAFRAAESEALELPETAAATEVDQAQRDAEDLARLEWRTLRGTVRRVDGGALPAGLAVVARRSRPYPRISEGSLRAESAGDYSIDIPLADARLAELARAPVDADGAFELERFPADGAWLHLQHELWFVPHPLEVLPEDDDVELLIASGACVEGRLHAADGTPAPGHELRAATPMDPWTFFDSNLRLVRSDLARSNDEGRYLVGPLPPGETLRLRIDAENGLQGAALELTPLAPGERRVLDVELARAATVAGVVLDEHDEPVPDARVRLVPAALDLMKLDLAGDMDDARSRTDETGRFRFESVEPGAYRAVLAASGFVPAMSEEPFSVGTGEVHDTVVLRARRGVPLGGVIVDAESGTPIEGARVEAALRPSMMNMRTMVDRQYREDLRTDAEGAFHAQGFEGVDGPSGGKLRVWVRADGYVHAEQDVLAGDVDVRVELERTLTLSGVVVSLEDAEPVTDFVVGLVPSSGLFDPASFAQATTGPRPVPPERVRDDDGRFTLDELRPGSYDLSVSAVGFARSVQSRLLVQPGEDVSGVVVYMQREARVIGRVIDASTGRPVPDALLTTDRSDMGSMLTAALSQAGPRTHTDADGRFALGGLGDDEVTITIKHRDFVDEALTPLRLGTGEQRDLGELTLSRGATVYGDLLDERGEPVAGLTVLVANTVGSLVKRSKTDADGRWRVGGLPADTYSVTRMDFRFDTNAKSVANMLQGMVSKSVTVKTDEERRVDLAPLDTEGTTLEGVVSSRAGPVADATLVVLPDRGGVQPRFDGTDAEGRFSIDGLTPGPWLLQVIPSDTEGVAGGQGLPSTAVVELVQVGEGPVQRHDVHVAGGRLAGRVIAADDRRALPGVRVVLERSDGAERPSRILATVGGRVGETYTGPDGSFAFPHLGSGAYDVVAGGTNLIGFGETGWARTRLSGVEVHETRADFSVEIALEPGAMIHGTVNDTAGKPLANVPVWARHDDTGEWLAVFSETQTNDAGVYRLDSLAPGTWTLVFGGTTHALTVSTSHPVREGEDAELDAVLLDGAEIVLERPGGLAGLTTQLAGDLGVIPSELTSLTELMSGGEIEPGQRRLARVAPGSYELLVQQGGELLMQQVVVVTPGQERVVVTLDPPD